ncbi:unnamed protein product [Brassicogethes aeneus]|uniref:Uncharacterized protein n=1 Tax=Brassicogethes aeneus TaxID=1431903 RepID=A0A9P0BCW3_BRAAE|nr:unnamed protein product [Brassicogethes aeneus]
MASEVDIALLTSNLKRLNKDELIATIVQKSVPVISSTSISEGTQEKLRNMVNLHFKQESNLKNQQQKVYDQNADKLETENGLQARLIEHLEGRIKEQTYIIELLKNKSSENPINKNGNMATSPTTSQPTFKLLSYSGAAASGNKNKKPTTPKIQLNPSETQMAPQKASNIENITKQQNANQAEVNNTNLNKDFKEVTYKKKSKKPEILGNNANSSLKGVAKMQSIYISRIETGSTIETMKSHLTENGITKFEVKDGYSKHPNIYKSYIITVPSTAVENLKNPALWPEGACVSSFLYSLAEKNNKTPTSSPKSTSSPSTSGKENRNPNILVNCKYNFNPECKPSPSNSTYTDSELDFNNSEGSTSSGEKLNAINKLISNLYEKKSGSDTENRSDTLERRDNENHGSKDQMSNTIFNKSGDTENLKTTNTENLKTTNTENLKTTNTITKKKKSPTLKTRKRHLADTSKNITKKKKKTINPEKIQILQDIPLKTKNKKNPKMADTANDAPQENSNQQQPTNDAPQENRNQQQPTNDAPQENSNQQQPTTIPPPPSPPGPMEYVSEYENQQNIDERIKKGIEKLYPKTAETLKITTQALDLDKISTMDTEQSQSEQPEPTNDTTTATTTQPRQNLDQHAPPTTFRQNSHNTQQSSTVIRKKPIQPHL